MKYVVNLDIQPSCLDTFMTRNAHIDDLKIFKGLHGGAADRDVLIDSGIITPENQYSPIELKKLMSHLTLWQEVAIKNAPVTIISDNARLPTGFDATTRNMLASTKHCDAVFWGVDTSGPVVLKPDGMPAMTSIIHGRHDFTHSPISDAGATPHVATRLLGFSGLICYTLFPQGARHLLHRLLPIGSAPAYFALPDGAGSCKLLRTQRQNTSLDVELSRCARTLNLRLCFPPLVYDMPKWVTPRVHSLTVSQLGRVSVES